MKRKLVALGKNCLMSAIPKKWLDQQKLVKGDYVEFEQVENYLLLSAKPFPKEKEISINIKETSRLGTIRILQLLYDAGFKKLNIKFQNSETLSQIMWSLEILEYWKLDEVGKQNCKIKTIEEDSSDFSQEFRRAFLMLKELVGLYSQYFSGKKELYEEIRLKYILLLRKTMNLKRKINTSSLPLEYKYYYFIVISFEQIADHYEYLLRQIKEKKEIPKELFELNQKVEKIFLFAYEHFYKFNSDNFFEFKKEIQWQWFVNKKNPDLVYHLRAISERIDTIVEYSVGIKIK